MHGADLRAWGHVNVQPLRLYVVNEDYEAVQGVEEEKNNITKRTFSKGDIVRVNATIDERRTDPYPSSRH